MQEIPQTYTNCLIIHFKFDSHLILITANNNDTNNNNNLLRSTAFYGMNKTVKW